jgi:hypothetical protein
MRFSISAVQVCIKLALVGYLMGDLRGLTIWLLPFLTVTFLLNKSQQIKKLKHNLSKKTALIFDFVFWQIIIYFACVCAGQKKRSDFCLFYDLGKIFSALPTIRSIPKVLKFQWNIPTCLCSIIASKVKLTSYRSTSSVV